MTRTVEQIQTRFDIAAIIRLNYLKYVTESGDVYGPFLWPLSGIVEYVKSSIEHFVYSKKHEIMESLKK